ncbi:MAG: MBL fold metallo-hydrolase [Thermodesulfobacteriota bacterium]
MRKSVVIIILGLLAVSSAFAESGQIQLWELVPGVWLHTSYYIYPNGTEFPSNGLVVRDGDGLVLVDTVWGELKTVKLLKKIKSEINLPILKALITHSHGDRLVGADVLKSRGIPVYSHPLTQKFAMEYGLPVPDHPLASLVERGATTTLGKLQVFYPGPAHAMDNVMVWLPDDRILFGDCAVRAMAATSAVTRRTAISSRGFK